MNQHHGWLGWLDWFNARFTSSDYQHGCNQARGCRGAPRMVSRCFLLLIPVDRVLNKIFPSFSTLLSRIWRSGSVKCLFLPLIILSDICTNIRCKTCINRFAYLNEGVEREELGVRAHALNSERIGRYKRSMLGLHNLITLNCSCVRQSLCITLLTHLHCKVNLLTIRWEEAAEEASRKKKDSLRKPGC